MLLCFALFCGGILYFMFWEPAWLIYTQKEIAVEMTDLRPGQPVEMHVERINKDKTLRNYTTTVEINCDTLKRPVPLQPATVSVPTGRGWKNGNSIVIPYIVADDDSLPPRLMPAGTCNLEGVAEIQGLIRTIHVPWKTVKFRVEAP